MSEVCSSKSHFSTIIVSDLILLCSEIFSLSYIIFFAPLLLKLISFLSPLFLTASTAFATGFVHENTKAEVTHLLSGCLLDKLRLKKKYEDDEFQSLDYLGMFGWSLMEEGGSPDKSSELKPEEDPDREDLSLGKFEDFADSKVEINLVPSDRFPRMENEFEKMSSNVEEKKKLEPSQGPKAENLSAKAKATMVKANSQRITSGEEGKRSSLMEVNVKYGSMRKEKEWKRTLGCKLFEERHNVEGGEGMDSLWEAYETDSDKKIIGIHKKYDEEEVDGQLCCLRALKLSAGKMNMGMGWPNLVKISKAIKGLHHHVSKHGKKVHNNKAKFAFISG